MKRKYSFISMVLLVGTIEAALLIAISNCMDKAIAYRDAPISNSIMTIVMILTLGAVALAAFLIIAVVSECNESMEREIERNRQEEFHSYIRKEIMEFPYRRY